ncbi:MAG: AI-2E family transporter [Chitinispirillia bacterium]|jgi:predicted PurR-regulated permease PerM
MNISNKSNCPSHFVVKFGYYALVIIVLITLIYCFKLLFAPIIASVLLSLLLDPFVNYLETKGFKRITIILGIYIFTIISLLLIAVFIVPKLITEAQTFAKDFPIYKTTILKGLAEFQQTLQDKFPNFDIPDFILIIKKQFAGKAGLNMDAIIQYLSSFFAILSFVVIIPIVTFFLLVDGHLIHKAVLRLIPNNYFEMTVLLIHKITSALKFFIRGQMIDAAAVGIMTAIGLAIIGLPYFLVIGLIAGIGNLIPYLGPVIGFVPALLVVALNQGGISFFSVISIVIVFVIVQFIEGTFIYPVAVGKSVDLHPLMVIIGVTIGGQLGGVLGMLVAVPLISIVKVLFEVFHSYLRSYSII